MAQKNPLPLEFEKDMAQIGAKSFMKDVEAKSNDLWMVPIDYINEMPGFNVRITDAPGYQDRIEGLSGKIIEHGFKSSKPLAIILLKETNDEGEFQNIAYVYDGHRRLAAARLANEKAPGTVERLPCVVAPPGTTLEMLTEEMAILNEDSEPLSPLELGFIVHRMTVAGKDAAYIAKRRNISTRYVAELLKLVGAPAKIQKMVVEGKVAATSAIAMMNEHGDKAATVMTEALKTREAEGKPARITEKHVGKSEAKTKEAAKKAEKVAAKKGKVPTNEDFLIAAIDYTLAHSGGPKAAMTWLKNWRTGDDPAVLGELEDAMGQPQGASQDKTKRIAVGGEAPKAVDPDDEF